MSDEDIDIWGRLIEVANRDFDGHLTILKFTTNWRVGFVTPSEREIIEDMAVGDTFAEAASNALYPKRDS
ncbi:MULTISPECIES: hypothetical protein [unclassified Aurantimonas]|uniref:hypothetical protein n=1 Tax=unclassified Aurantimonas TaxID=2638230 RepID=UPI002E198049|nr:hypothetical protein [Aurantimonas sp. A3-2-R12]